MRRRKFPSRQSFGRAEATRSVMKLLCVSSGIFGNVGRQRVDEDVGSNLANLAVELPGDVTLEAANDLFLRLALSGSLGHVGTGAFIPCEAVEDHGEERTVGLAVPAPVEAVALVAAGGRLDGRGATEAAKLASVPRRSGLSPPAASRAPAGGLGPGLDGAAVGQAQQPHRLDGAVGRGDGARAFSSGQGGRAQRRRSYRDRRDDSVSRTPSWTGARRRG